MRAVFVRKRKASGGITTFATLSPTNKHASITLSNGNLTATTTTGSDYKGIAASMNVPTGAKVYVEMHIDTLTTELTGGQFGVAAAGASFTPDGNPMYYGGVCYLANGSKRVSNAGSEFGGAWSAGDTIAIAVDQAAGKVWFAKNGVWQASGDPAAGTNPAASGLSSMLIGVEPGYGNGVATMKFGASAWAYAPPIGYTGLGT